MILAGKCRVDVTFWYYLQEYVVVFTAEPSSNIISANNLRHTMLEVRPTASYYFKYDIHQACKDRDDCAQNFAQIAITEMVKRQIDYLSIISELRPLISACPQSLNEMDLVCFHSKENIRQCANATNRGSCVISNKLTENEITLHCNNDMQTMLGYINISDSGSHATFDVHCNRSFCNQYSTLKAAKDILFKYDLTKTSEGRLINGSQFIKISVWLIISLLTSLN